MAGVECAVKRGVIEHMRGHLCENCNAGRKYSPPKKRRIARVELSFSYVVGGF